MHTFQSRVTIEGRLDPGTSAVFRVVIHGPVNIRMIDGRVRDIRAHHASIIQCAVYAAKVLENGWQPYEQPSPCAYLPLDYSALERKTLPKFGAAFVERRARRGDFQTFVIEGDSDRVVFLDITRSDIQSAVAEICQRLGIDRQQARQLAATIRQQLPEVRKAA